MTTTNEAGYGQGWSDGCEFVTDLHVAEHPDRVAGAISAALKSPSDPDEALINALSDGDLRELVGCELKDADGEWTVGASSWLVAYNKGWRAALADRLAAEADARVEA